MGDEDGPVSLARRRSFFSRRCLERRWGYDRTTSWAFPPLYPTPPSRLGTKLLLYVVSTDARVAVCVQARSWGLEPTEYRSRWIVFTRAWLLLAVMSKDH